MIDAFLLTVIFVEIFDSTIYFYLISDANFKYLYAVCYR